MSLFLNVFQHTRRLKASPAQCKASNLLLSPVASLKPEERAAVALVLTGLDLCAVVLGLTRQTPIYILTLGFVSDSISLCTLG